MRRSTGIELGPDACVMVAARRRGGVTEISAVHAIERDAWPSHDVAVTRALAKARQASGLPRRAAVVLWGLPDEAAPAEPSSRAAVRPVVAAGFRVRQILTPPQALAALAASRPDLNPESAVVWMALNTYGVALAIVRQGQILFARTFDWDYTPGIASSRGQLLQRYALVSHLAPEVQRGIAGVRASWGVGVERAVTCGNLPELRSLTMPLIEELDLEVETLDSLDGLKPVRRAHGDRAAEWAPAIRLAAAAAVAPPRAAPRRQGGSSWLRAAAALLVVAGLGWLGYAVYLAQQRAVPAGPSGGRAPAVARGPDARPSATPAPAATPPPQPAAVQEPDPVGAAAGEPAAPLVPPLPPRSEATPSRAAPAVPPVATPLPGITTASPPAVQPKPAPPVAAPPASSPPAGPPPTTAGATRVPPPAQPTTTHPERGTQLPAIQQVPALPAPPVRTPAPAAPLPLKDPLPRIDSILIDHTRRLAIIEGRIVGVGDAVGPRVVEAIDGESVLFREPSGLRVRVPLRGGRTTGL